MILLIPSAVNLGLLSTEKVRHKGKICFQTVHEVSEMN